MDRRKFVGTLATVTVAGTAGIQLGFSKGTSRTPEIKKFAVPKRVLGKTGVEVSALIIGGVSGMMMKPTAEFNPPDLANAALDAGITYFDTSNDYGGGQSEINYGMVLARRRKEVFLATKCSSRTYDGVMKDIEESLKRLQTDHLDLYQIHGVGAKEDISLWGKPDGVMKALHKLKDEKVTRFIGVTGHEDADVMIRAIEMYEFDTILTTFNAVPRRLPFRKNLLPIALKKKMGIIAMKVMGGGEGALAIGNAIHNEKKNWYWDEAKKQFDSSTLLRYVLGLPVSCAVVGMKSFKELEINLTAAAEMKPLSREEQIEIEKIMM
jgi:aryl-alcohol dehydrogenase-like predicted oxidoreductase